MQAENTVTVSGTLHLIHGTFENIAKPKKYLHFSVKQETPGLDGSVRKDFLLARVYDPETQATLKDLKEGTTIRVRGDVRSSLGSGEMYINVASVQALD